MQHRAECVDVHACIECALACGLLGRHVLGRAEREAGARHPVGACLLQRQRNAEIRDEGVAVLQQDVLGLDVAVNDAVRMGIAERVGDLPRETHRLCDG